MLIKFELVLKGAYLDIYCTYQSAHTKPSHMTHTHLLSKGLHASAWATAL